VQVERFERRQAQTRDIRVLEQCVNNVGQSSAQVRPVTTEVDAGQHRLLVAFGAKLPDL